jgi:hypothetical protein
MPFCLTTGFGRHWKGAGVSGAVGVDGDDGSVEEDMLLEGGRASTFGGAEESDGVWFGSRVGT